VLDERRATDCVALNSTLDSEDNDATAANGNKHSSPKNQTQPQTNLKTHRREHDAEIQQLLCKSKSKH